MSEKSFTIRYTNIIKGVATILLLCHHLFGYGKEDRYIWTFVNEAGKPLLSFWSEYFGKACVGSFLLLSGYGLSKSFHRDKKDWKMTIRFVSRHIFKCLQQLWLIYVLCVPVGYVFGRTLESIYGENIFLNFLLDFCGLAYLCGTPTINATWWFMSAIFMCYVLFPVIDYGVQKYPMIVFALSIFLSINFIRSDIYCNVPRILEWLLPFTAGCFCERYSVLDRFMNNESIKTKKVQWILLALSIIYILTLFASRFGRVAGDTFVALAVIVICLVIVENKYVRTSVIEKIGELSAGIFMIHTFIYSYYFRDFIYAFKYPILILMVTLLSSMAISFFEKEIRNIMKKSVGKWFAH